MDIITYNVRTLSKSEHLSALENCLKKYKNYVVGISEVRRMGKNRIESKSKNSVLYYFGKTKGLYGVGFLVPKTLDNNVLDFRGYTDRVAVLKLSITDEKSLMIIQVYAPTSKHSESEVSKFYDTLTQAYEENHSTFNIVMGDFNAKIGENINSYSENRDVLGPYGLGERNKRGDKLIQFANRQNLSIMNSFFYKKPQYRWTWKSNVRRYNTKNEIDYILCCNNSKHLLKKFRIITNMKFSSDHRPVHGQFSLGKIKKKNEPNFFV
ncbi:hypothetical protein PYW07_008876 [Mythimna separata]|uniref:Endonuclease/exonuclease/phosphatase domain-containing protein n=1 Tax=Mythimna separata TaxID=271217 RepID=A0AAD7YB42_MYTSE|nr:hypothetical protein PYW07_008876 [Mythimna separata]